MSRLLRQTLRSEAGKECKYKISTGVSETKRMLTVFPDMCIRQCYKGISFTQHYLAV